MRSFQIVRIILLFILAGIIGEASVYAMQVKLEWQANTEPDLAGYKIYYKADASGQPYSGIGADQGNSPIDLPLIMLADPGNPAYTLTGLDNDKNYFFVLTAYDNEIPSLESAFSSEVVPLSVAFPQSVPDGGPVGSVSNSFCVNAANCLCYTLTGTASVGEGVKVFGNGSLIGTTTGSSNGTWSTQLNFGLIQEGDVNLTVETGGNTFGPITGLYDKTAPTVEITYSEAGPYKFGSQLVIFATFHDSGEIVGTPKISINYDGWVSDVSPVNMTFIGSNTLFTYPLTIPVHADTEGWASISITGIKDLAGNTLGQITGDWFIVNNLREAVGNVNRKLDMGDIILIIQYLAHLRSAETIPSLADSDANGNGEIDIGDVLLLINALPKVK